MCCTPVPAQQRSAQLCPQHTSAVLPTSPQLALLHCRVRVLCPDHQDLDSIKSPKQALQLIQRQGNCDLGFLQFFNLHRTNAALASLVQNRHLTETAAQLLGVRRLRLYQVGPADEL